MMEFKFRPELLEYRAEIMEALNGAGYSWLVDYRSIDLDHRDALIEIDGVKCEDTALGITRVLAARFPWGIRVYERDFGDRDWMVVLVVRGHGMKFGGCDDGGSPDGTSFEISPAEPEKPEGTDNEEPIGAVEEGQATPTIGGLQMKIAPPAPEVMFAQYAKLLHALSRVDYVPLLNMPAPVRSNRQTGTADWDGMVDVIVRLVDLRVSMSQLRQVLPLLGKRRDLVDLLAEATIVARRDRLDAFLADLPTSAASQYELLALVPGVFHHGLTVLPPSPGESWRLAFSVHASAISQVLDQEMQRVAAEGES
jgi:hypothetical protein